MSTSLSAFCPCTPDARPAHGGYTGPHSAGAYDFGSHIGGQPISQQFTLTNTGGQAGPVSVGLTAGVFTLTANTCQGTTLGKGQACTVTVTWTPLHYSETDSAALTATAGLISASLSLTAATPSCLVTAVLTPASGVYFPGPLDLSASGSSDTCGAPLVYYWICLTSDPDTSSCTNFFAEANADHSVATPPPLNAQSGYSYSIYVVVCTAWPDVGGYYPDCDFHLVDNPQLYDIVAL